MQFAPRIIQIRSVVLENEWFEVASRGSKWSQKTITHYEHTNDTIQQCMRSYKQIYVWSVFGTLLKPLMKLQITRSLRLFNGFGWSLVQNEGVVLLVLFQYFTVLLLQVKWTKTLNVVWKVDFGEAISRTINVLHTPVGCRPTPICARIISRYTEMVKRISNTTGKVYTNQISSSSEHFGNIHAEKNI